MSVSAAAGVVLAVALWVAASTPMGSLVWAYGGDAPEAVGRRNLSKR